MAQLKLRAPTFEVLIPTDPEFIICRIPNLSFSGLSWQEALDFNAEVSFLEFYGRLAERRPSSGHMCAGCRQEIVDPYLMRVHPNMEFHSACLKCSECQRFLDESQTTFVKDGRTFCKEDYYRRFGQQCARCRRPCLRNDLVMRARHLVYHCDCFSCAGCDRRLATGDHFMVKGDGILCGPDCEGPRPIQSSTPLISSLNTLSSSINNLPGIMPEQRPPSMNNSFNEDDSWETSTITSMDQHTSSPPLSIRSPKSDDVSFGNSGSSSNGGKKSKKDKQTTRVRTVLNENQLLILKKCYNMNSRPDALLKEQLVEMTGLNARVIRVWFQNKRCKDKKRQIQLREMQTNADKEAALNGIRMNGVGPLVALSPSTHVDNSLGQPIDIHQFPQWGHPMEGMGPDQGQFHQQQGPPPMNQHERGNCPLTATKRFTDLPSAHYSMHSQMMGFPEFSPHLHATDLSSPSCSE